jgi:hypothetical protein
MGIAILALLVLGFLVIAYLAAQTWQVLHVVLLVFLFLATLGFSILAAATLKTQARFRTTYTKAKSELDNELARTEELTHGDLLAGDEASPALRILENKVSRELVDRGRVWRNLSLKDRAEDTISLDTTGWDDPGCESVGMAEEGEPIEPVAAEGAAAETAQARPTGLIVGTIVFAFRETPIRMLPEGLQQVLLGESPIREKDEKNVCRVPTDYLGQYRVEEVATDSSSITLKPVIQLGDRQIQMIQEGNFSWVLYEKMPADSHHAFTAFSEDQLKILLPAEALGLDAENYAKFISQYTRDQKRAEEADPPERKWFKLKFLKEYSVAVDLQNPVPEPQQPFDPTGRSQSALLRQEGESKMSPGDEGVFDSQTKDKLVAEGIAEVVEPIFVRQLRDYEHEFLTHAAQVKALERDIERANEELTALNESIDKLKEQIAFRTDESNKLAQDKEGFEYERQVISDYRQALEAKWQAIRTELSRLYRINKQLVPSAETFQTVPSSVAR